MVSLISIEEKEFPWWRSWCFYLGPIKRPVGSPLTSRVEVLRPAGQKSGQILLSRN